MLRSTMRCSTPLLQETNVSSVLRTTAFAGVVNVAQRGSPACGEFRNASRSDFHCRRPVRFLFLVLNWAERSFLYILISLYFVHAVNVASKLGHRRSCQCTEAVGHPPFSVPLLNHRHLASPQEGPSVLFEILLGSGKGLKLVEGHRGYLQVLSSRDHRDPCSALRLDRYPLQAERMRRHVHDL